MNVIRSAAAGAALLLTSLAPSRSAVAQGTPPSWSKGATCYEVFVRSFFDSDGDGIGDLNGLTEKLDYIKGLGASCIWLMPITESPSYHGYDVINYYKVNPDYGTNDDFTRLVAAAHKRGIAVIVDMVLNHSSDQDPHFQAALHDTTSPYRAWYRFSPTPLDSAGPWGAPAWHRSPVRDEYYYGIFWSGMPDLNYDTPAVREEAMKIADYWLGTMGADGLRLDAVQYLVEQGSCLKDCAGTHQFLREYQAHIDSADARGYTIGEVWDPLDTLLTYYPHQLTAYFTFELSDSLRTAVNRGTVGGMLSEYLRLQDTLPSYRWSPILDNHDMTRAMTALGDDPARARLGATLLLTLPGLPYVYYGEELGMVGDKPDPRLRTPMQWNGGHGVGFTTGTPWESAQPDSASANVAVESGDPGSLLNLYRRLMHLRKENDALADGRLVPLESGDPHVLAYLRRTEAHVVLVVANLSDARVTHVSLRSGTVKVLPTGNFSAVNLLAGPNGGPMSVDASGRIEGYVPVASLRPRESLVLELAPR